MLVALISAAAVENALFIWIFSLFSNDRIGYIAFIRYHCMKKHAGTVLKMAYFIGFWGLLVLSCGRFTVICAVISFALVALFDFLASALHEIGHLLFCKAFGLHLICIRIGVCICADGKRTFSFENNSFGKNYCIFEGTGKSKLLWTYAGGLIMNLLFVVGGAMLLVGSFQSLRYPAVLLLCSNTYKLMGNIIPHSENDAAKILQIKRSTENVRIFANN